MNFRATVGRWANTLSRYLKRPFWFLFCLLAIIRFEIGRCIIKFNYCDNGVTHVDKINHIIRTIIVLLLFGYFRNAMRIRHTFIRIKIIYSLLNVYETHNILAYILIFSIFPIQITPSNLLYEMWLNYKGWNQIKFWNQTFVINEFVFCVKIGIRYSIARTI